MYDIQGANEFNKRLVDAVEEFKNTVFPITEKGRTLELTSLKVDLNKQPVLDPDKLMDLRRRKRTFSVPIYGTFVLRDEGKVVDRGRIKIGDLPIKTAAGTFMVGGTEYAVSKMLRLRSGVYTDFKENGEVETKINLEKGYNLTLNLNPKDKILKVKLESSHYPIYTLLHYLGISDDDMRKAWGQEVFSINKKAGSKRMDKVFLKFVNTYMYTSHTDPIEAANDIEGRLSDTVLDPKTTKKTLGKAYNSMDAAMLLDASKRLLEVMRKPDTRDNKDDIYFMKAFDEADILTTDYLTNRKKVNDLKRKLKIRIATYPTIDKIVQTNFLNKMINPLFNQSTLSEPIDFVNPLDFIDASNQYTKKGEGGIGSIHAITTKTRDLYPSQAGFVDPVNASDPNAGIVVKQPMGVKKEGLLLKKRLINTKTGKVEWLSNDDINDYTVAFPGKYDKDKKKWKVKKVYAIRKGAEVLVPVSEVDYTMIYPTDLLSIGTNIIPFVDSNQGNRVAMGARQLGQAVNLINREKPLVQSLDPVKNQPMLKTVASKMVPVALEDGKVSDITSKSMTVKYKSGRKETLPFYKNYPIGSMASVTTEPAFKAGDKVKKGDILMTNNFMRDDLFTPGVNLNVAYMPFKALNSEDAMVISESAAKKLTSKHVYTTEISKENATFDLNKFKATSLEVLTVDEMKNLDERGIIKEGSRIIEGMPVAAYMVKRVITDEDKLLGRIHKSLKMDITPRVVRWEKYIPGKVIKVRESTKSYFIDISTVEPARKFDKITGQHGNKGVISEILPDKDMPITDSGEIADVIISPLPVQKRLNPGQNLETYLSKAAYKKGSPYIIENFSGQNNYEKVKKELDKYKISPDEHVTVDGIRTEKPVSFGKQYFLKLKYMQDKGYSARSYHGPVGFDKVPSSGGKEGGKSIDQLTLYSLMAHGAKNNLRDISVYKSEDNPEFWRAYITGNQLPSPSPTFSYNMAMDYLKGAGISPYKKGNQITLTPMTDKLVTQLSNGEVSNAKMVVAKTLLPEKGGLFDPWKTGGTSGEKWTHISLAHKIPNPMFEEGIRLLLGISQAQFDAYISGVDSYKGKTHGDAILQMLKDMNIKKEFETLKSKAIDMKGQELNNANRRLRFMKNLIDNNIPPDDLFISKVGVVPPNIRPIYPDEKGNIVVSSLNNIYKDVILTNEAVKTAKGPKYLKHKTSSELYKQVKRLYGLTTAAEKAKLNPKKATEKGFIELFTGDTPKSGVFQKKVVKKRQNLSGMGIVAVDTTLDIDEAGIPRDMAYKIFEPFVARKMVSSGLSPIDAANHIKEKTPEAERVLNHVAEERKVIINRSPTLHKYGIMAFKPKLVPGKGVKMPLMVVKGFNMDFDGDKALIHVPVTTKANKEAEGMLPSRNLIHPLTGAVMNMPSWEDLTGLHMMTKEGKKTGKVYKNKDAALSAYHKGEIKATDLISVKNRLTSPGRLLIEQALPIKYNINAPINNKIMEDIVSKMAKSKDPTVTSNIGSSLRKIKELGDTYATYTGASFNFKDMAPVKETKEIAAKVKTPSQAGEATSKIKSIIKNRRKNTFYDAVDSSGAKGQWAPLAQMLGTPVMFAGLGGKVPPILVKNSYVEGLDPHEYWAMSYGARKGSVSKVVEVSEPGAFSKELIAGTMDMQITMDDCGTKKGIAFPSNSPHILQRFLAIPVKVNGKVIVDRDTMITPDIASKIQKARVSTVIVRTPLKCRAIKGICRKCHGGLATGELPPTNFNIGVLSAQTMGEPLTQMAMRVFHTGSTAGSNVGAIGALDRIIQVTALPQKIPNKAVLSPKTGVVKKIEKSPVGGWNVTVSNRNLYVPSTLDLKVKKGDKVKAGSPISSGNIHPMDIYKIKGHDAAMSYISDELYKIYTDSGVPLKHVTPEVITRAISKYSIVKNPGSSSSVLPGDMVDTSYINYYNENTIKERPTSDCVGKRLAEPVWKYHSRQRITDSMAKALIEAGYDKVKVFVDPIEAKKVITSITKSTLNKPSWLDKMNFRYLKNTIREGVESGATSYISGPDSSLLSRYIYGPTVIE